ncbi:MAG: cupin domain-containing protein [Acidiferrobacterales bacterium]
MELLLKSKFSVPVEKSVVTDDWGRRGYSCDWFTDPPGREWNDFVHNCNELVTVVEGRLEMTVAGATCVVEPGDEVFIPKGAVHSVKNVHSATTRWLYGYD